MWEFSINLGTENTETPSVSDNSLETQNEASETLKEDEGTDTKEEIKKSVRKKKNG